MMREEAILNIIKNGEKNTVEFKLCSDDKFPKSVYESICSFLNTRGGIIIFGINDNKEIIGVNKDSISKIQKDFTSAINNSELINPIPFLSIEEIEIYNKTLLYIQVPEGSDVYKYKNKIYLRNYEGDFNITNNRTQLTNLYLRKQTSYTENIVYPNITIENNLKIDLIEKVKKIFSINTKNVEWETMDTLTFLKKNSLYVESDNELGQTGITLAGILLFGEDLTIHNTLPGYRIDLLKRVNDVERYDDREIVECNLIEAFYKCMAFVEKHLPAPFDIEGVKRINTRDIIFREIIANMLIHTEYIKNETSRLIIYRDRVVVDNANRPNFYDVVKLDDCKPVQKNPNIGKIFRMLEITEQIGSGTMKLLKYCKRYGGRDPIMEDNTDFKLILPINVFNVFTNQDENRNTMQESHKNPIRIIQDNLKNDQDSDQDKYSIIKTEINTHEDNIIQCGDQDNLKNDQDNKKLEMIKTILDYCETARLIEDIMNKFNFKHKSYFRTHYIKPLIQQSKLSMTIPDKPTSRYQKYITIKH